MNNAPASDVTSEGSVDLVLATIAEHATLALDSLDYLDAVLRTMQDQRAPDLAALVLAQRPTPTLAASPNPERDAAANVAISASAQLTKLRQLVADTLARRSTDDSVSPTYLLNAIDEHAELASDPAAYLHTVLTALQENRELDLEAMLHAPANTAHLAATGAPVPAIRRPGPPYRSEPMPEPTETILIANAGMVLAAPYLPRLFDALNLTQGGSFVDEPAAERAVHLLQFMVTGQSRSPEYQLTLNKLLCGLASAAPVVAGIDITERERETIEGMIEAIIAHWKTIGKTSIDGLRQSFLARKGDLHLADDAWQLKVHPGSFDMLLDRLPWSFSIIKYAWMARPLHVTWR